MLTQEKIPGSDRLKTSALSRVIIIAVIVMEQNEINQILLRLF